MKEFFRDTRFRTESSTLIAALCVAGLVWYVRGYCMGWAPLDVPERPALQGK